MAHFYTNHSQLKDLLEGYFTTSQPDPKLGWKRLYIFDNSPMYQLGEHDVFKLDDWMNWHPTWTKHVLSLICQDVEDPSAGRFIYFYCDNHWYYVFVNEGKITFFRQYPPVDNLEHGDIILCPGEWSWEFECQIDEWLKHARKAKEIEDQIHLLTGNPLTLHPLPLSNEQLIERLKDVIVHQCKDRDEERRVQSCSTQ